jgi:hypothetical protein
MDIKEYWQQIRQHFNRSFRTNFHVSIASVNENNHPTVTPIGSLFLNRDQTGFYFEKYPTKLPANAKINKNICVLAVNSSLFLWLRALLTGKFHKYPAIKLYGKLGSRRIASDCEISKLRKRMKATRGMKGNTYLWGDMRYVREITFSKAEKIDLGKMTN